MFRSKWHHEERKLRVAISKRTERTIATALSGFAMTPFYDFSITPNT